MNRIRIDAAKQQKFERRILELSDHQQLIRLVKASMRGKIPNDPCAQTTLGIFFMEDKPKFAIQLLEMATRKGIQQAMFNIATIYGNTRCLLTRKLWESVVDFERCVYFFEMCCEGLVDNEWTCACLHHLTSLFSTNNNCATYQQKVDMGFKMDDRKAMEYISRGLSIGSGYAFYDLGSYYLFDFEGDIKSLGIVRNQVVAVILFEKGLKMKYTINDCLHILGVIFSEGYQCFSFGKKSNVRKNSSLAVEYLRRGAKECQDEEIRKKCEKRYKMFSNEMIVREEHQQHKSVDVSKFFGCGNDCSNVGRKLCSACRCEYYCSSKCQKEHWKKRHKKVCCKKKIPIENNVKIIKSTFFEKGRPLLLMEGLPLEKKNFVVDVRTNRFLLLGVKMKLDKYNRQYIFLRLDGHKFTSLDEKDYYRAILSHRDAVICPACKNMCLEGILAKQELIYGYNSVIQQKIAPRVFHEECVSKLSAGKYPLRKVKEGKYVHQEFEKMERTMVAMDGQCLSIVFQTLRSNVSELSFKKVIESGFINDLFPVLSPGGVVLADKNLD